MAEPALNNGTMRLVLDMVDAVDIVFEEYTGSFLAALTFKAKRLCCRRPVVLGYCPPADPRCSPRFWRWSVYR
jgi:hypothetical protein